VQVSYRDSWFQGCLTQSFYDIRDSEYGLCFAFYTEYRNLELTRHWCLVGAALRLTMSRTWKSVCIVRSRSVQLTIDITLR
jgi:hypothetical protein